MPEDNLLVYTNTQEKCAIMSYNVTADPQYHNRMALAYGTIRNNIREVAIAAGYRKANGTLNALRLAKEAGISTGTLYFLFTKPEHFRQLNLITLAKLCKTLKCQPGDLFQYVPGLATDAMGIDTSFFTQLQGAR